MEVIDVAVMRKNSIFDIYEGENKIVQLIGDFSSGKSTFVALSMKDYLAKLTNTGDFYLFSVKQENYFGKARVSKNKVYSLRLMRNFRKDFFGKGLRPSTRLPNPFYSSI